MAGTVISNLRVEAAEFYAAILREAKKGGEAAEPVAAFATLTDELERSGVARQQLEQLGATKEGRARLVAMALARRVGLPELDPGDAAKSFGAALAEILNRPAAGSEAIVAALEAMFAGEPTKPSLEALGDARVGQWPMDGLRGLASLFLGRPEKRPSHPTVLDLYPTAVKPSDVAELADVERVLAGLLGAPELVALIRDNAARLEGVELEAFVRDLGAFAQLADMATTMIDYTKVDMGWAGFCPNLHRMKPAPLFPMTRDAYRARDYHPLHVERSRDRQEASRKRLGEALAGALERGASVGELAGRELLREIGLDEHQTAGWAIDSQAVAGAIRSEALIPLRALFAATAKLDHEGVRIAPHRREDLDAACRALVVELIQNVVAGTFTDWRMGNEKSQVQLACLGEAIGRLANETSIELTTRGRRLKTREERGVDLLWLTKIGGPSHGFDMISQCLLPLVANARTIALVVDDDGYGKGPAARSYLRILPASDGTAALYLEMLQRDFDHWDEKAVGHSALKEATIRHAIQKAKELGVPLAILDHAKEPTRPLLDGMDIPFESRRMSFILEPSNGVFEASDSLLGQHHGPQLERTRSVDVPVFVIEP
jgi:hypothetical protein